MTFLTANLYVSETFCWLWLSSIPSTDIWTFFFGYIYPTHTNMQNRFICIAPQPATACFCFPTWGVIPGKKHHFHMMRTSNGGCAIEHDWQVWTGAAGIRHLINSLHVHTFRNKEKRLHTRCKKRDFLFYRLKTATINKRKCAQTPVCVDSISVNKQAEQSEFVATAPRLYLENYSCVTSESRRDHCWFTCLFMFSLEILWYCVCAKSQFISLSLSDTHMLTFYGANNISVMKLFSRTVLQLGDVCLICSRAALSKKSSSMMGRG